MRSFSKFIAEGPGPHTTDQSRATDNGVNTSDVQNPRAIRALNAYVGAIAMMNALQGAKQQCESFLKEFSNDEPDTNSDSGDVG